MQGKPPAYGGSLPAKELTTDKRADSVNEKWPENLACCHKRLYINACAAHHSFPLNVHVARKVELVSGHFRELKIREILHKYFSFLFTILHGNCKPISVFMFADCRFACFSSCRTYVTAS